MSATDTPPQSSPTITSTRCSAIARVGRELHRQRIERRIPLRQLAVGPLARPESIGAGPSSRSAEPRAGSNATDIEGAGRAARARRPRRLDEVPRHRRRYPPRRDRWPCPRSAAAPPTSSPVLTRRPRPRHRRGRLGCARPYPVWCRLRPLRFRAERSERSAGGWDPRRWCESLAVRPGAPVHGVAGLPTAPRTAGSGCRGMQR